MNMAESAHPVKPSDKVKVACKWFGDFVKLFLIIPVEDESNQWLLFYNKAKHVPDLATGTVVKAQDLVTDGLYKTIPFISIEESVPNDVSMSFL